MQWRERPVSMRTLKLHTNSGPWNTILSRVSWQLSKSRGPQILKPLCLARIKWQLAPPHPDIYSLNKHLTQGKHLNSIIVQPGIRNVQLNITSITTTGWHRTMVSCRYLVRKTKPWCISHKTGLDLFSLSPTPTEDRKQIKEENHWNTTLSIPNLLNQSSRTSWSMILKLQRNPERLGPSPSLS